ncbi:MAG: phosphonate transporter, periplasmic phosphonate-binding protein [Candidatus Eremiobacteraeota bacterium]|nr:phosphonate transporter, periplasmic phosphonate-binding protein [Candidatus Eremiobacteraeota bacterium]
MQRSSFLAAVAAFGSAAAIAPTAASAADELTVAFIPEIATTPSSYAAKKPLVDMLARATKRNVKLIIPTNYAATVEAIGNDSVDLAYFGGLTYLKARKLYGVVPLVQRDADRQFHSLFITTRPQITKLSDLRDKSFAFGDPNSTSGHLQPVKEMIEAGIDPDKDMRSRYTGNHTATAIAVNNGSVDAGAMDETVYRKLADDKTIDVSKTRVFYTSRPFVDYVWVVRKGLDPATADAIKKAFVTTTDPAVLDVLRATKYVAADDAEYEPLRKVAERLKLL